MKWLLPLVIACPAWGGSITPDALDKLPVADVYVLGEIHDNADHHQNQARAVAALRPGALVWEMLGPDQAARVVHGATMADLDALLDWSGSGWPEFSMYFQIFVAADEAAHYGADVPRSDLMRAMDGEIVIAGYGLDVPLAPEDQVARELEQDAAHCGLLPAEMLAGMVAAQRLRDAALAQAVVQAMADTGGPVVVIAGSGHARRDIGVPAVLAQVVPALRVLSVGQVQDDPGPDAPFDMWITSPARTGTGADPCDALR